MNRSRVRLVPAAVVASTVICLLPAAARADQPPQARELRVQEVDGTSYFHVRFDD